MGHFQGRLLTIRYMARDETRITAEWRVHKPGN